MIGNMSVWAVNPDVSPNYFYKLKFLKIPIKYKICFKNFSSLIDIAIMVKKVSSY